MVYFRIPNEWTLNMTIVVRGAINTSVIVRCRYNSNNSQNCEKRLLASTNLSRVRPSAHPHGTTWLRTRWVTIKFHTLLTYLLHGAESFLRS